MQPDPRIIRLLREQVELVRHQEEAYREAADCDRTPALDAYLATEQTAVALLTAALGGEVEVQSREYDHFHVLNISATAADSCAVRLAAQTVLNMARPLLCEAARIDEAEDGRPN